jgi:hypothetical protein
VTGSVGIGTGVSLITAGGITTLAVSGSIGITASVTNDVNNQGVIWSITPSTQSQSSLPIGSLPVANQTPTTAIYYAPTTGFPGETSATITATSKSNPLYYSSVTIVTTGSALANQATLFPANVNVAYGATLTVSGGVEPFTWSVDASSPPLPPGIALQGSSTNLGAIAGTPTQAGTYPFIIDAVDSSGTTTPQQFKLTLKVNPQSTCVLVGQYTLMASGFRGGGGMTHVANINVDSNGAITGEQDYKDGHRTTANERLISSSNCINRQTNSGQITLNSASGSLLYNVSVTPPDANGAIQSARIQLIGSGDDSASGLMQLIDPSAISSSPPVGNFAFGLLGVQKQEPYTIHFANAGRFTTDASGSISAGVIDSNNAPALSAAGLTGTLTAPDANGRGTATFIVGSQSSAYVYYVINANKMYLMNVDPQTTTSPRLSGFMTRQIGNVNGTSFDANAFVSPSVLSLWGAISGAEPIAVQTMGLVSGTAAGSGSGQVNATLDITNQSTNLINQSFPGEPFTIDAVSGRGTMTLDNGISQYALAFYLDAASSGYLVQTNTPAGSGGLLEAQAAPPVGGFPSSLPGFLVGGTQFAMAPGPITLTPLISLSFGSLSSNFTNGQFYIDPSSGRGLGTLTQAGVGQQAAVLYLVSPNKIDLLRFSTRAVDGNIDWLVQNID